MSSRLLSRLVQPTRLPIVKKFPTRRTVHDTNSPSSNLRHDPSQAASAEAASSGLEHQSLKRKKWHTRRETPKKPAFDAANAGSAKQEQSEPASETSSELLSRGSLINGKWQKSAIDKSGVQPFLELAERGEAGVPEATKLLTASAEQIKVLPRQEQRERAAQVKASLIAGWLIAAGPKQWETINRDNREFSDALCWHLEAEDRSDAMHDWLRIWCNDESLQTSTDPGKPLQWPGIILAGSIEAKLYWAEDRTANSAIEFLFSFKSFGHGTLRIVPAVTTILKALHTDQAPPCNPSLYRKICDMHSKNTRVQTLRHQPQEATNQLFHPTNASPQLMLRYFRDQENVDTFMQWSKQSRLSMAAKGLRAAYMLRLRGQREDAKYMESVSIKTNEWLWNRREVLYKSWRNDPKLKKMHAESPFVDEVWSEMEEGV